MGASVAQALAHLVDLGSIFPRYTEGAMQVAQGLLKPGIAHAPYHPAWGGNDLLVPDRRGTMTNKYHNPMDAQMVNSVGQQSLEGSPLMAWGRAFLAKGNAGGVGSWNYANPSANLQDPGLYVTQDPAGLVAAASGAKS